VAHIQNSINYKHLEHEYKDTPFKLINLPHFIKDIHKFIIIKKTIQMTINFSHQSITNIQFESWLNYHLS